MLSLKKSHDELGGRLHKQMGRSLVDEHGILVRHVETIVMHHRSKRSDTSLEGNYTINLLNGIFPKPATTAAFVFLDAFTADRSFLQQSQPQPKIDRSCLAHMLRNLHLVCLCSSSAFSSSILSLSSKTMGANAGVIMADEEACDSSDEGFVMYHSKSTHWARRGLH